MGVIRRRRSPAHLETGVRLSSFIVGLALVAAACGDDGVRPEDGAPVTSMLEQAGAGDEPGGCAHVEGVGVTAEPAGTFRFDVTVRSDDTGDDKYADAWEIRAPDGAVLGVRELLHPHVEEQPFTRSLGGVEIPASIRRVDVAARDSVLGFCGRSVTVEVPGR